MKLEALRLLRPQAMVGWLVGDLVLISVAVNVVPD